MFWLGQCYWWHASNVFGPISLSVEEKVVIPTLKTYQCFKLLFSSFSSFFSLYFTTLKISLFSPVVGCLQDPFLGTNNRGCPLPTSNRQSKWLSLMILTASSTKSVSFLIRTSGKYYTQAGYPIRPTPTFFNTSFVKYVDYSNSTAEEKPLL